MENPNTNCLEGMRCPKCGSYGPFYIDCFTTILLYDDGSEGHGDTEWDGSANCVCSDCQREGLVKDFREGE